MVIFAMERTLFSALNQAMLLCVSAMGFLSIGSDTPDRVGTFLMIAGLAYVILSYAMHVWRLHRLQSGQGLMPHDALVYTGVLAAILILSFAFEIAFAMEFPYMKRSKAVEIASMASSSSLPDR